MSKRPATLLLPRGFRREQAAEYVGVSPTKFDEWVREGVMPKPARRDGVVVWDRRALDAAFDALNESAGDTSWDDFGDGDRAAQAR